MKRRRFNKRDLEAHLKSFNSRCRMCQCEISGGVTVEWDHAIPLAIGGEDELSNLQPLCKRCHRIKTNGDVTRIAKTVRQRQKHLGIKDPNRPRMRGQGFQKAPPQNTASRRPTKITLCFRD